MSILRRNVLIEAIVWFFVVVVFFGIYLTSESPESFMNDKVRKLMAVIPIVIGYITHFAVLGLTKREKKVKKIVYDERDEITQNKANNFAYIFTLLYVFLFADSLYEKYFQLGSVPVVWLWILAWSTVSVTFFISALFILITDLKSS